MQRGPAQGGEARAVQLHPGLCPPFHSQPPDRGGRVGRSRSLPAAGTAGPGRGLRRGSSDSEGARPGVVTSSVVPPASTGRLSVGDACLCDDAATLAASGPVFAMEQLGRQGPQPPGDATAFNTPSTWCLLLHSAQSPAASPTPALAKPPIAAPCPPPRASMHTG